MTRRYLFSLAVLYSLCVTPCWAQTRGGTSGGFSSGGTTGGFGGTSTGGFGGTSSGGYGGTSASTGTFGQRSLGSGISAQNGSARFARVVNKGTITLAHRDKSVCSTGTNASRAMVVLQVNSSALILPTQPI